jgi:hypothetical protein
MGSPAPDAPQEPGEARRKAPPKPRKPSTRARRPSRATASVPAASLLDRLRQRLEALNEWFEGSGITVPGLNFGLVWWKKAGPVWMTAAFIAVGTISAGGFTALMYRAASSVPDWVGDFGVRFDAEEWDYKVLTLDAVARNVTIRRDERSAPVFTAAEVRFDGNLWSFVAGLFRSGASYDGITIRKGEVHVERSLVGGFNWQDFLDAVPAARQEAAIAGLYRIREVHLDDVRVVYTEHVPGNSAQGVIQTAQATVFVEGITGEIFDLERPKSRGDRPTRFKLEGRSADGIVQIKGVAGLFDGGDAGASAVQNAGVVPSARIEPVKDTTGTGGDRGTNGSNAGAIAASTTRLDGPYYQVDVYLGHVGMAALEQMVPATRLVSTAGTLQGTLNIDRTEAAFTCTASLEIQGGRFKPQPRPDVTPVQHREVERDLIGFEVNDRITDCASSQSGSRANATTTGASTNSLAAVIANLNAKATRTAPDSVRVYAALDQQDLAGIALDATIDELARRVARRLGIPIQTVDPRTGRPIVISDEAQGGNAVTRGLRSIGGGIKRLFGGGGGDRNDKKSGGRGGGS